MIACVVPLEGDACASEKKYQKMLTGTSSIAIIASFMMVPRTLEFVFSIIFFYCCRTAFDKGQRKTWKGLSLGVIVLAALAGIVVLLISSGGEGFIGLRISVWLATWVGSMLIFEPLVGLISYCCIRCGEPKFEADIDAKPTDTSPLLGSSDLPSTGEDSDRIVADVGDNEISDTNSSIRVDTDNSSTDIEKGLSPVYTHDPLASQDVDLGDASVSSDEEASVSMPINSEM